MRDLVKEKITNRHLTASGRTEARRSLIIMDECDGMGAGDRGGVADLADTIRKSKIPIICICNDKYSQKMRPLRNVALELDFRRPTKTEVAKRLQFVAQKEGLEVSRNILVNGMCSKIQGSLSKESYNKISTKDFYLL